jgi:hypothetical protein
MDEPHSHPLLSQKIAKIRARLYKSLGIDKEETLRHLALRVDTGISMRNHCTLRVIASNSQLAVKPDRCSNSKFINRVEKLSVDARIQECRLLERVG